jgi:hypothetical protein
MDETYRKMGAEREADFERDALKWHRATEVRQRQHSGRRQKALQLVLARIVVPAGKRARMRGRRAATGGGGGGGGEGRRRTGNTTA